VNPAGVAYAIHRPAAPRHSGVNCNVESAMNRMQLPNAIRTTAAALAVFMAVATLNSLISVAEPQLSAFMAQTAAREAERMASTPRHAIVLQEPMHEVERACAGQAL
jgi:hypothetical protein